MKLGAESQKKTIIAVALFVVALFMVIRMIAGSGAPAPAATPAASTSTAPQPRSVRRAPAAHKGAHNAAEKTAGPVTPSLDPRLNLAALKQTEEKTYDGTGRNIFTATEEPRIPQPIAPGIKKGTEVADSTPPQPPPKPAPPPINLKFFGFASGPDHKRIFLSQGDEVFVASEGDIVQRRYKIVKVNPNNIEVLDVLSNNRQTIPLTAG